MDRSSLDWLWDTCSERKTIHWVNKKNTQDNKKRQKRKISYFCLMLLHNWVCTWVKSDASWERTFTASKDLHSPSLWIKPEDYPHSTSHNQVLFLMDPQKDTSRQCSGALKQSSFRTHWSPAGCPFCVSALLLNKILGDFAIHVLPQFFKQDAKNSGVCRLDRDHQRALNE